MHISTDERGDIVAVEDRRVATFLDRLDLRARPQHIAGVLVRRGLVRPPAADWRELSLPERKEAQDLLILRLSCVAVAEGARSGAAWVRAARLATAGWRPSKWTLPVTVAAEVTVSVRRLR